MIFTQNIPVCVSLAKAANWLFAAKDNTKPDFFIMEIWKDIPGYEGYYQVSNLGRVKSIKRRIILNTSKKRYSSCLLYKDGFKKTHLVHRLVAIVFLDNPNKKPCVNHIDGDKQNNHVKNLEWCTHKENALHAWSTGLNTQLKEIHKRKSHLRQGENHWKCKLKESQIPEILKLKSEGLSHNNISKIYGVSKATIKAIVAGRNWKHVPR